THCYTLSETRNPFTLTRKVHHMVGLPAPSRVLKQSRSRALVSRQGGAIASEHACLSGSWRAACRLCITLRDLARGARFEALLRKGPERVKTLLSCRRDTPALLRDSRLGVPAKY